MNGRQSPDQNCAFLQLLPKGFHSALSGDRHDDFSVVEGHGVSHIGDTTVSWGPKDIFVAPSWKQITHKASEDAVIFSFSDRPVQEKLGLWREDRGNA